MIRSIGILIVASFMSTGVFAQGAPGGSSQNLTTQISALAARLTAVEERTSLLEGALTPDGLAGEYAIIGFRMGAAPLNNPAGFVTHGIAVGGATQSGSASVVVTNGVAQLIINQVCNVGKTAFLWVGNTNLVSGGVGKVNGVVATTNPPDTSPNSCESYPWGQAGVPIQVNGSDLVVTQPDEDAPLEFYSAGGGRIWVLNNLDYGLVGTTSTPDYAAELVMLVRKAPASP